MSLESRATEHLKAAFGPAAAFRDGQLEAIAAAVRPGGRTLVVQRTGWGKSLVYFIATRLLRDIGRGPTLLISPLLSLMRNQQEMAAKLNLRATSIDSTNRDEWFDRERAVTSGEIDLLLISPERLGNPSFRRNLLPYFESSCALLVIDEAHCISDWGHDFRPDYQRILTSVSKLNPQAAILGTTATATDRVIADIRQQLGDVTVLRGPLMRESLRLRVFPLDDQAERLAFLAKFIPKLPGTGIIYALTINDARRIADWLSRHGVSAKAYHAELKPDWRIELERKFYNNEIKVLCATTALGMGYDKGDVRFVVHFQRPGSVISYYQQVGRAGRSISVADIVLLEGREDDEINTFFIESAFPGAQVFDDIKEALVTGPKAAAAIVPRTNATRKQIEKALRLMEVDGAVVRDGEYTLVNPEWTYERLRSDQIMAARRIELEQMQAYVDTPSCRMEFLARALDDPLAEPCGKCDRCIPTPPIELPRESILEAMRFLKQDVHSIESKVFYPPGVMAEGRKKIPDELRLNPGLAISVYGDAGWGKLVREGKYGGNRYSDELIEPCLQALASLPKMPNWITWVPSLKRKSLVPDFARRLAAALEIPAIDCVVKDVDTPAQKEMLNSTRQFANAWGAFRVTEKVPDGRCLLFDDIVDSGWTLTAVGVRLRQAGADSVTPFALATARPRDDS